MAKRHGPGYWAKHLDAWYQSDLTQREYCAKHGLHEHTFDRWHCKRKRELLGDAAAMTLVPATMDGGPSAGGVLRLSSPSGWRIEVHGGNAKWIAELLRQLP
jgi:hypothetical protein